MTVQTIPMVNVETGKTADVHPNEVENWRTFGWRESDAEKSPVPPPPPFVVPPSVSAPKVVELPKNWTEWKAAEIRAVAEAMTGRTPDNRDQAIQVVLAAIRDGRAKLV